MIQASQDAFIFKILIYFDKIKISRGHQGLNTAHSGDLKLLNKKIGPQWAPMGARAPIVVPIGAPMGPIGAQWGPEAPNIKKNIVPFSYKKQNLLIRASNPTKR